MSFSCNAFFLNILAMEEEGGGFTVDESEAKEIEAVMGFKKFETTKQKDHSKSSAHAVMKVSKRKHSQFVKPAHKRRLKM